MNRVDNQYQTLLENVLRYGVDKPDRMPLVQSQSLVVVCILYV